MQLCFSVASLVLVFDSVLEFTLRVGNLSLDSDQVRLLRVQGLFSLLNLFLFLQNRCPGFGLLCTCSFESIIVSSFLLSQGYKFFVLAVDILSVGLDGFFDVKEFEQNTLQDQVVLGSSFRRCRS